MGGAVAELDENTADRILAVQLTVAWAGETSEPPRLGWWKTDLVDPDAGGDLLRRLLPRTHRWAGLELAREAARRIDQKARSQMADRDKALTLFHLGFGCDEQLDQRIRQHKAAATDPSQLLPQQLMTAEFKAEAIVDWIRTLEGDGAYKVAPGGRKLTAPVPDDRYALAANLAAALVPLADSYPMPFCLEP